jgi:hypothetical protein
MIDLLRARARAQLIIDARLWHKWQNCLRLALSDRSLARVRMTDWCGAKADDQRARESLNYAHLSSHTH